MGKKVRKRLIVVILFLIVLSIYFYISIRGEYLQILGIGEEYVAVFRQNMKYKFAVRIFNFIFLYTSIYVTTRFIEKGLKKFFDDEKKEMPKLPNKSIALIMGTIITMYSSNMITEKAILAINSAVFGITDPIFNIDIAYYMFQKPFIELLITYFIGVVVALTVYVVIYYVIVFNRVFEEGIDLGILKKNTFIKHVTCNTMLIVVGIAALTILNSQNILFEKFLTLPNGIGLKGAGLIDVTVKLWGYRILAVVIVVCAIIAIKSLQQGRFKKVTFTLLAIPTYLFLLFIVLVVMDLLYVKKNEFDKEKKYIEYNIQYTKNAYNINIDEIEIENGGTITLEDLERNEELLGNIRLISKEIVLATLKEEQTSLGDYSFNSTKLSVYNINGKDSLVYISPREIIDNNTRTYNNKTYEYTHGYGVVLSSATDIDASGIAKYIQSSFDMTNAKVPISEPRIYFGLQTNETIITNVKDRAEYDYPLTSDNNIENVYEGKARITIESFRQINIRNK